MMEVQKYLQTHSLADLSAEFAIKIREYPEDGLFVLNYDQIESPKAHPIVMECRSLILDAEGNVVSRSFDRFFNYGEAPGTMADFDIARAHVFEKADGSLIKVYRNPTKPRWEIATRSSAFAETDHKMGGPFREWVLKAFGTGEDCFQLTCDKALDPAKTVVFEYTGPENRIVTQYPKAEMVLLGVRDNRTGEWDSVEKAEDLASRLSEDGLTVRPVGNYPLQSFDEIVAAAHALPTLTEGYVCWDPVSDKRVKIKNPAYVAVHHLRENGDLSLKRVYSLVLMNEHEEYLAYFPEDRPFFAEPAARVEALKASMLTVWEHAKGIETQKNFALEVKDQPFSAALFTARKTGKSPVEAFDEMTEQSKLRLFGFGL